MSYDYTDDGKGIVIEDVTVKGRTEKGLWVAGDFFAEQGINRDVFIPEKAIHDDSDLSLQALYDTGDTGTLAILLWLVESRGWVL